MANAKTKTPTRSIVSVVFDFDLETLAPRHGATEYTYFFTGPVKKGDLAVVLSPRNQQVTGVLVVNKTPSASAVRRATKSLIGIVDVTVFKGIGSKSRTQAVKEAWDRFVPGVV